FTGGLQAVLQNKNTCKNCLFFMLCVTAVFLKQLFHFHSFYPSFVLQKNFMFLIFAYVFSQSPAHMTACTYAWDKPPENTEKMAILPAM
ncbi:MAG TPA: hypothetical protein H9926_07835, partial [Candidatus Eisenbergiella intestinigallinarum]|nr:hypothetical protein [Candidatus Eisenbergiella intestinigallinarum]